MACILHIRPVVLCTPALNRKQSIADKEENSSNILSRLINMHMLHVIMTKVEKSHGQSFDGESQRLPALLKAGSSMAATDGGCLMMETDWFCHAPAQVP